MLCYFLGPYCRVRSKKNSSLKRPPPEDHLVGSLQEINEQTVQHRSLIAIPPGTPKYPELFKDRCLPVAFVTGRMLVKAAYQGKEEGQKMLSDLKCFKLSRSSKELKNSVGEKIWKETKVKIKDFPIFCSCISPASSCGYPNCYLSL